MKKVLIATHIDFWRQGAGHMARILALVKYLSKTTKLTVLYGGVEQEDDATIISKLEPDFELVYLERKKALTVDEYGNRFREFLAHNRYDACIIEYVELSFLLDCIPYEMKLLLDIHDIQSDRNKSFADYGLNPVEHGFILSTQEEYNIFRRYDAVMPIQSTDHEKIGKVLGMEKVILAPHPPEVVEHEMRNTVDIIGFVGSTYEPNVHAITTFIKDVWPSFQDSGITLAIYGEVGKKVTRLLREMPDGVNVMGFVPDLKHIYRQIDVVINPVMFGAGLKIKNMEALANGRPLITTTHGAGGIMAGAGEAFIIADTSQQFIDALSLLIGDHKKRKLLAGNAITFMKNNFSPSKCFQDVLAFIDKG
jgi:glycosyltransferase involved in cell wall biosynthesis